MAELKPRSFRVDDDTADKLKALADEIGGNQQEVFSKLIEAYEFQKGKTILTDKKEDIERFEGFVTLLTRMYMTSLEENQNITDIVHAEFEALLMSKDRIIQDLQDKTSKLSIENERLDQFAHIISDERDMIKENLENLQLEIKEKTKQLSAMLADKEQLNKALATSCNEQKQYIEDMKVELEQSKKIVKKFEEEKSIRGKLEKENLTLSEEIKTLEKENARQVELHRAEINNSNVLALKQLEQVKKELELKHGQKLLELELDHNNILREMEIKNREIVNDYQNKYRQLLEKIEKSTNK